MGWTLRGLADALALRGRMLKQTEGQTSGVTSRLLTVRPPLRPVSAAAPAKVWLAGEGAHTAAVQREPQARKIRQRSSKNSAGK